MGNRSEREIVERVVRQLRFPFLRLGTNNLVDAVLLCSTRPELLGAITKEVYRVVAQKAGTGWRNVEFNLRTARDEFWESGNRALLNEMAGFELQARPSVGEIINYIVGYIRDNGLLDESRREDGTSGA